MLEPVEDETDIAAKSQSDLKLRLGIFAGLTAFIVLTVSAIFVFAPEQSSGAGDEIVEGATFSLQQIVLEDENGVIPQARSISQEAVMRELMAAKGCQALPDGGGETLRWVNEIGDPLTTIRPSFPGNWRVHQTCPTEAGGALFATLSNDGVALSRVESNGQTRWTQMVTVESPNQSSVELLVEDQSILLIYHDRTGGRLQIEAYDENGGKSWRQTIETGPSIQEFRSAKTSLGDVLIAWREPTIGLRLVILSPLGGVLQQSNLGDRTLAMRDIVQDDLGQTLILYGEDQAVAELISRTSESAWQRALDSTASPLGALSYEASFFVFASINDTVLIWGLNQFGAVSEVLNIRLLDRVVSGQVRRINAVEAVLTVQLEDADPVDLILDLRRLEDALEIDPDAALQSFSFSDEIDQSEEVTLEMQDAEIVRVEARADAGTRDPGESLVVGLPELEPPTETADEPEVETSSSGVAATVASDANDQSSDRGEQISLTPEESASSPREARCTFSCVSTDGTEIEYVLMQTVEVFDGERLTDVSLRLNEAHENLCGLSGGEPVSEYTRECNPG